ncbi:aldolase/citrate lyase family protein [Alsobacter sp. SYSU M60028]|uniref:Aldolase/citrate lyase family protein n=1 Tax=Alsobacter ponti TaxID=2962936 RepID=A0ABT1L901_9HYPH|nr:aldolase/citrate lyase family protein [Alsobacter ponti]MCP8937952.1 aldolase/citrate lyase family protein [Alsobacter ponti]
MLDPHRPTLRYRLDKGDTLGVIWLALGSVALTEIAARARPDAIVLDVQHGLWERASMEAAIGVVPSDIPVLVRVAENSPVAIGQALDAGAEGVIVPLVETAKQARRAVDAARYPPRGSRSGGGIRPLGDFVDYVHAADRAIVVCVMVETAKGVKNARDIAAVEGVDMVFIGTGDLALSLGTFPNFDARHEVACSKVHAACQAEYTLCGTFTGSLDAARAKRERGYRMVVTANDMDVLGKGFAQATSGFAAREKAAPAAALPPDGVYGAPPALNGEARP